VPITSPWTCEEAEVRESRQQAAGFDSERCTSCRWYRYGPCSPRLGCGPCLVSRQVKALINGFGNGFGAYCRQHGHFVPRDQFCPYCRSELSRRRRGRRAVSY